MSKTTVVLGVAIMIIVVAISWYFFDTVRNATVGNPVHDYKNTTYVIEEKPVTLVNGEAEVEAAPGSTSMITTKYFGNVAKGDLNNDSIPDLAFLLTQEAGGSGTFFYVVAAIQSPDGNYKGSNAIFLGDRIAPQTTEIRIGGQIVVNYAERQPGESYSTPPRVGVSKKFLYSDNQLLEVVP